MFARNGVTFVPAKKASSSTPSESYGSASKSSSGFNYGKSGYNSSGRRAPKSKQALKDESDSMEKGEEEMFNFEHMENLGNLLPKMSEEQMKVLKCVIEGHSVFITGVAGTGKSFLLECIIQTLSNVYNKKVVVTASTGISAVNIGGATIHSFAGIRTKDNGDIDTKTAWKNDKEWNKTDVLIIDEISMIDAQYFDHLSNIATEIRCFMQLATNRAPRDIAIKQLPAFGGIQVILCGDFLQLPPVAKSYKNEHGETVYQKKEMCFKADCWKRTIKYTFELTNVFRQEEKPWVNILNSIRMCRADSNAISTLKKLETNRFDGLEKSTVIHTLNKNVDGVNERELAKLKPPQITYKDHTYFQYGDFDDGVDIQKLKEQIRAAILSSFNSSNAAQEVSFRVGAQVMMTKNDFTNQLVNGTRGEIIGFVKQSASDLSSENKNIKPHAQAWIDGNGELLPKVVFTREENGKEYKIIKIVHPAVFETDGPLRSKGIRLQIPLKLAYAMTVHKTQGLTLEKCVIDLSTVFSPGQIYVALSRAKTMKYLQVKNFNPASLSKHINRMAIEFYSKISNEEPFDPQDKTPKDQFVNTLVQRNLNELNRRKKLLADRLSKIDMVTGDTKPSASASVGTKRKQAFNENMTLADQIKEAKKMKKEREASFLDYVPPQAAPFVGGNKKKWYCVAVGRKSGIYNTWPECKMQVDQFKNAKFKSFETLVEAQQWMKDNCKK